MNTTELIISNTNAYHWDTFWLEDNSQTYQASILFDLMYESTFVKTKLKNKLKKNRLINLIDV